MNFKEFKEKRPELFNEFISFNLNQSGEGLRHALIDRRLYDFFDENRIHINVLAAKNGSHNVDPSKFTFHIYSPTQQDIMFYYKFQGDRFDRRIEAEQAAFEKAFELLEKKLQAA